MRRIYVAGPYSIGDVNENVKAVAAAACELIEHGFEPYVPIFNHYRRALNGDEPADWTQFHPEYVVMSDAIVRLFGESRDADRVCELAKEHNIEVCGSVAECMAAAYR